MGEPIPESRLAEIEALCAEIAERIRTQDNAGTAHPYFVVYEGDPNKSPDRWCFVSLFLTRDSAKAFILGQRHNLRRPFVFVESAHNNHEIRAAREVFAALPELAREVRRLRAEVEIAKEQAKRQREWFVWCQKEIGPLFPGGTHHNENARAYIEKLRAEIERLRQRNLSAETTTERIRFEAFALSAEVEQLRAVAVAAEAYRDAEDARDAADAQFGPLAPNSDEDRVRRALAMERNTREALDDALRDAGIGGGA